MIKEGKSAREIWASEPARAAQKDVNARSTLKIGGKVRYRPDGTPLPMIATPVFGYKSHISIDRRFGFIREAAVTSASALDGRRLANEETEADFLMREDAIGLARAEAKLTPANLAYNMDRLIFHERRMATGWVRPQKRRNTIKYPPDRSGSRQVALLAAAAPPRQKVYCGCPAPEPTPLSWGAILLPPQGRRLSGIRPRGLNLKVSSRTSPIRNGRM